MRFDSLDEWYKYLDNQFEEAEKKVEEKKAKPAEPRQEFQEAVVKMDSRLEEKPVVRRQIDMKPEELRETNISGAPINKRIPESPKKKPQQNPHYDLTSPPPGIDIKEQEQRQSFNPDPETEERSSAGSQNLFGVEIPSLDAYMPWLNEETITEQPVEETVQEPEPAIIEQIIEPTPAPKTIKIIKPKAKEPQAIKNPALSAPRPRWKSAEANNMDEQAAEIWNKTPSHVKFLATISGYQAAAPVSTKRKRRKGETRETLIARLVDPFLTLEETASLLGVCSTTIRRYTDKGWLLHHRTAGNQRRFRLSDIVSFLEQHRKLEG